MKNTNSSSIRLTGEEQELILGIYAEFDGANRYRAQVREAVTGSESDVFGDSTGELVNQALRWAGVEGLRVAEDESDGYIRIELREATERADFPLEVKLFTNF